MKTNNIELCRKLIGSYGAIKWLEKIIQDYESTDLTDDFHREEKIQAVKIAIKSLERSDE